MSHIPILRCLPELCLTGHWHILLFHETCSPLSLALYLFGTSSLCCSCRWSRSYLRGCFAQDGIALVRHLDIYHMVPSFFLLSPCICFAFVTTGNTYISCTLVSTHSTPYSNRKFINIMHKQRKGHILRTTFAGGPTGVLARLQHGVLVTGGCVKAGGCLGGIGQGDSPACLLTRLSFVVARC